ncbi:MAG: AAA family ATPase [Kiritimatiellaeota bacterium]|nr:AAA family ATPase [Kiritimatiellota bacterium]
MLQGAMHWAVGKAFFGIMPGEVFQKQGMRILIVQAENDEGDLAEMRDGVLAGCDDLTDEEKARAGRNILIATVTDKSAEAFAAVVEALILERGPFDLVMVDPAFAYLGGDSNSQKDVSHFMRELFNPLAQKHGVGVILAHHTNKPLRGKEKDSWAAGDFAYLGAGSAEWINPARAALALRSIGSDTVFEFRGAKRGKRLRWMDDDGNPTNMQHIAHDGRLGVICWRKATAEEIADVVTKGKGGRRKQYDDFECVHAVLHRPGESQIFYLDLIAGKLDCGKTTVRRMLQNCVKAGWIAEQGDAHFRRYGVTERGAGLKESHPSVLDWVS